MEIKLKFLLLTTSILSFNSNAKDDPVVIFSTNIRNNYYDRDLSKAREFFRNQNYGQDRNGVNNKNSQNDPPFEDSYVKDIKRTAEYKKDPKFYTSIIHLRNRLAKEFAREFNFTVETGYHFNDGRFIQEVAITNVKSEEKNFPKLIYEYADIVYENKEDPEYDYLKDRVDAIQKTVNEKYKLESIKYQFKKEVAQYLVSNDILPDKFITCSGTRFQQILHSEILDILNQTYDLSRKPSYGEFCSYLAKFNSASCDLNHHGKVIKASKINDFCFTALKYIKALGQGVVLGAENATAIILHPIDTLVGISNLGGAFCELLYEIGYLNYCHCSGNVNALIKEVKNINTKATIFYNSISNHVNKLEGPDVAKHTTAMIVDLILSKQLGKCAGNFANYAKGSVVKVVDKIRRKEQPILAIEGLPAQLAVESTDILKMEIAAQKAAKTGSLLDKVRHAGEFLTPEVIKIFAELEHEVAFLYNKYKDVRIHLPDITEPLKITREFIEHLIVPEIKLTKKGVLELKGFHHDLNDRFHKCGFLKQVDKQILNSKSFKSKLNLTNCTVKWESTQFPSDWNHIELFDNIIESCKNLKMPVEKMANGKTRILGTYKNIEVELFATSKGHLKTSYPFYEIKNIK